MSGAIVAGAAIGGAAGWIGSEMMGDSAVSGVSIPEFQEPEYYSDIQDTLKSFGEKGLEGEFPEYYQPLGEIGGETFEKYLTRVTGDVTGRALETSAKLGQRGGAVGESVAQEVGDISAQMRYQDLLTGLQGRQSLLGTSLNTLANVRESDLSYTDLVNQFALGSTSLALGKAGAEDSWESMQANMITSGIMGGAQIGTSIYAANQLANSNSLIGAGGIGDTSMIDNVSVQQDAWTPSSGYYGYTDLYR